MEESYKKAFTANHSRLVRKLTAFEVIESCYTNGLITLSEKGEIETYKTDLVQLSKLFGIFHRRYFSDRGIFQKVFRVLKEVNDEEGGYIDHVIYAIEETLNSSSNVPSVSHGLLSQGDRARLQSNEATILTTLDVSQIIPDLISEGVISFEESFSIENESDFKKRVQKFLQILSSRSSEIYQKFISILMETEVYEQLAHKLVGLSPNDAKYDEVNVEDILRRGHVPPPPQNYVKRPELIKAIRKELRKLKNEDSWVLVSGLPGYGKSVLAAESVRNASLLREVFIGGVYWLSVGRMVDSNGEIDAAAQLERIQNFIVRMDSARHRPSNLESATDYLQQIMNEQYPQSLLILDDVWEYETAQVFAVRCRTLVTSRNSLIANGIQTNHVYKVSIMEGFTLDEGKEILSKSTSISVPLLPSEAKELIRLCYGSPIALDIIGAMLKRNPTPSRWAAVVDRLRKQRAGTLPIGRDRKGSGSTPDMNRRRSTDQRGGGRNKETLNTSISLSEESLPADVREYFHKLVIFEPDTIIRTETLATLWEEDEFSAEEIMMDIVGWSLAQKASKKQQDGSFLSFVVHDMILSYLRDIVKPDLKKTYQQNFVKNLLKNCNGNFTQLKPDGYVYQKLLYHIFAAEQYEMLGGLLSDLQWVAMCCKHWDPNSLLESYKKYRKYIPEMYTAVVNEFQLFLSYHLDKLGKDISVEDVIQLALNTPSDTSPKLLEQAKAAAKCYKDTLWLVWCNQSTINRPTAFLQLQPHSDEVKYCQYYDGGTKVVSCSTHDVKTWESSTGKVLETFSGHTNVITHCVISESGDLLVTCSDDLTCKVWELPKVLLVNFKEHLDGVQCCDLSPDNSLVVSVDLGSAVKVWFARTGEIKKEWVQSEVSVLTSCLFTPNGDRVIISDQDGIIRSYNLNGQPLLTYSIVGFLQSPGTVFDISWSRGPSRTSSTGSNPSVSFTIHNCVCSKDGKLLAAAVGDCTAKVWLLESENCVHSFRHSTAVLSVDFSPDGKFLATGSVSGVVKVWSLSEGCPVFDLPLHYDWVTCVKFSPQGSHILSSAYPNGSIKIIENKHIDMSWKLYRRRFTVLFNKDINGEYIPNMVCFDQVNHKLEICQGLNGEVVRSLDTVSQSRPRSWDMSHDGHMIAVGYDNGILQLFDMSGKELWINDKAHDGVKILHCWFSPDSAYLVTCGDSDNNHKVWSVSDGSLMSCQPNCNDFWVKPCIFYDDSTQIASTTPGRVLVWNATDGKKLFYCDGISDNMEESILCVNISKDNSRLVASAANGRIAVWCANTGDKLFTGSYVSLKSHNIQARFCSLNYNGTVAAVGHDDATLKIYNIKTGTEIVQPNTPGAWMISTEFSPDGQQVVTLSDSIQWWSVSDGKLMKQFLLNSTFGKYIYFSPDFKLFVTIDNTGILYILKYFSVQ